MLTTTSLAPGHNLGQPATLLLLLLLAYHSSHTTFKPQPISIKVSGDLTERRHHLPRTRTHHHGRSIRYPILSSPRNSHSNQNLTHPFSPPPRPRHPEIRRFVPRCTLKPNPVPLPLPIPFLPPRFLSITYPPIELNKNRWRYFRWSPRTAWIGFVYAGVIPTALGYLFWRTDVS